MKKVLIFIILLCGFSSYSKPIKDSDTISMKVKLVVIDSFTNVLYPTGIWEKKSYFLLLEPIINSEYRKHFDTIVECKRRFVAEYLSLGAKQLREGGIYQIKFLIQKEEYSEEELQDLRKYVGKSTTCSHLYLYPRLDKRYIILDIKEEKKRGIGK